MYDIFSLPEFEFPENFLWGSGVAGHQVEGNNIHSQYWWEENNTERFSEKSGMTCNHYKLYKEDTELMRSLGHKAFRFSVEWSRIEPSEGCFCEEAIEHYIDELRVLKENGIKTFVTLIHFTVPMWFEKLGGFTKMENLKYFERYVKRVVSKIHQYVDFWNVINEFNLGNSEKQILHKLNSIRYHATGYHIIKEFTDNPVSSAHALVYYMPYQAYDKFDNIMTEYRDWQDNEFFFHAIRTGEIVYPGKDAYFCKDIKGTCDYWSVNCYVRDMIDSRIASGSGKRYDHKILKMIDMPFYLEEMYPEGMLAILTRLKDLPVYITENGCSCDDDRFRIVYLSLYLSSLNDAIKLGVDIRGYLYWSLMDNYEWGSYKPKFGLVSVDRETFARKIKPSALFYKEIIEHNGLNQNTIRKYLKEIPSLSL